jgi:hypothetical protein
MTKMNRSGVGKASDYMKELLINLHISGYKLRRHIGKALRSRSEAIRNALARYNTLALQVVPPRPTLDFTEVLEYSQLGYFPFLKDSRYDVNAQPWASPLGRQAMDHYYTLQRAKESVVRIKIEARRLMTWMAEENIFYKDNIARLSHSNPDLAHALQLKYMHFCNVNIQHNRYLDALQDCDGFGDPLQMGISKKFLEQHPDRASRVLHLKAINHDLTSDSEVDEDEQDNDLNIAIDILASLSL